MEDKNEEEKFIKLEKKDIGLLKSINKDSRYKELKPVKEINDIIKDLKIYEDKIGEKCAKHINKIAEEGEFKKSKLISNCKEINDAIKKKEKEEKKKKGKKPRAGKAVKLPKESPITQKKKKDKTDPLIKLMSDLVKSKSTSDLENAIKDYANYYCQKGISNIIKEGKLKKVLGDLFTTLKDNASNIIFEGKIGWDSSGWNASSEFSDIVITGLSCLAQIKTVWDFTKSLFKKAFTIVSKPFRRGSPPSSGSGGGNDDDDDDNDDKPDSKKDDKKDDKKDTTQTTSTPQSTGADAFRQMMINTKKKNANTLRQATMKDIESQILKASTPSKESSTAPAKESPPKESPPKEEPPKEEPSYFRTGINTFGYLASGKVLSDLYESYYPEQVDIGDAGDASMGDVGDASMGDEGLGRVDEDIEDAMDKERQEIQEAEDIEREDRKKSAEEYDRDKQIQDINEFIDNMGVSRNAMASIINPKLAGLSTFQLQNPLLIASAVQSALDLLYNEPAPKTSQQSLMFKTQEQQEIVELEKAEQDRMNELVPPIETDAERIQRESRERAEFDAEQDKIREQEAKQLLEQQEKELQEQINKTKKSQEETELEQQLKEMEEREKALQEAYQQFSLEVPISPETQSTINLLTQTQVIDSPSQFASFFSPSVSPQVNPFSMEFTASLPSPSDASQFQQQSPTGILESIETSRRLAQSSIPPPTSSNLNEATLALLGRPRSEFNIFHYDPIGQTPPSSITVAGLRRLHNETMNRLEQEGLMTRDLRLMIENDLNALASRRDIANATGHITAQARRDYIEIIRKYGVPIGSRK